MLIVDAIRSGAPPGTVHRVDASQAPVPERLRSSSSTHAIGVAEAIELARALGRLPAQVVLYGVEGRRFDAGGGSQTPSARPCRGSPARSCVAEARALPPGARSALLQTSSRVSRAPRPRSPSELARRRSAGSGTAARRRARPFVPAGAAQPRGTSSQLEHGALAGCARARRSRSRRRACRARPGAARPTRTDRRTTRRPSPRARAPPRGSRG